MDGSAEAPAQQQPLSRRAQKRLARQEVMKEERKVKRQAKKEEKREAKQQFLAQHETLEWAPLPHEPANLPRAEKRKLHLEAFKRVQSPMTIAIDCAFEKYMTENEKKSMHQQITFAYAALKESSAPCHLSVCGLEPFLKGRFDQMKAETTWSPWGVTVSSQPVETMYPKEKLVYLSADSETVLDTLDEDAVYVVGGIVDRNRHKGLCANKAKELGLRTAKFPLDLYFSKHGFSRVLATNHCVDILLEFAACGDWMQSCKRAVPVRKTRPGKGRRRGKKGDDGEKGDDVENEDEDEGEDEDNEQQIGQNEQSTNVEQGDDNGNTAPHSSQVRPLHVLVIGEGATGLEAARQLAINHGASVLLARSGMKETREWILKVKKEKEETEIAVAQADMRSLGDVLRIKDILHKRFARSLDVVIFAEVGPEPFMPHCLFVRECYRMWYGGPGRYAPKFLFASEGQEAAQFQEWLAEFQKRLDLPDHFKHLKPNDTVSDEIISWLAARSTAAAGAETSGDGPNPEKDGEVEQ